jgi:hypothetical protein
MGQSHVVLVHGVLAGAAPLLDQLRDDVLERDRSGGDQQLVGLGQRPAQAVSPGGRQLQRQRRLPHPLAQGCHVLVLGIHRPRDRHQNGQRPHCRGQAGAQDPAETAAAPAVGVVARIHLRKQGPDPAGIGMGTAAPRSRREAGPHPAQRSVTRESHVPRSSPGLPSPEAHSTREAARPQSQAFACRVASGQPNRRATAAPAVAPDEGRFAAFMSLF